MEKSKKTIAALGRARRCWEDTAEFRSRRERYKRFTYGDQWGDPVADSSGKITTQGELALSEGKRPLTNNMIRRLVKCVVGHFRMNTQQSERHEGMPAEVVSANNLEELDSRMLEEFLISGCAVQKVVRERRPYGEGLWVDNVSPAKFFVNHTSDPRGFDVELVGMIHDMSLSEVVMRFAGGNRQEALRLAQIYGALRDDYQLVADARGSGFTRAGRGKCRVIEVWTLEMVDSYVCHDYADATLKRVDSADILRIEAENKRRKKRGEAEMALRWELLPQWRCDWLAPDGTLLDSYTAERHPFVFKLYPLVDGEVHSLVEDVIDQQIVVNRLITLIEQMISVSAKGTLLFPVDQLAKDWTPDQVAAAWARPGAVIPYRAGINSSIVPQQISHNATNVGAHELLSLEMDLFQDISGVTNALMGKASSSTMGYQRFDSEVRNALVSISDLLQSYESFLRLRNQLAGSLAG